MDEEQGNYDILQLDMSPFQLSDLNFFFDTGNDNFQTGSFLGTYNGNQVEIRFYKENDIRKIEIGQGNSAQRRKYRIQSMKADDVRTYRDWLSYIDSLSVYRSEILFSEIRTNNDSYGFYVLEAEYDKAFLDRNQLKSAQYISRNDFEDYKDEAIALLPYSSLEELTSDPNMVIKLFDLTYLSRFTRTSSDLALRSRHIGGFIYNERTRRLYPIYSFMEYNPITWLDNKIASHSLLRLLSEKSAEDTDPEEILNVFNQSIVRSSLNNYANNQIVDFPKGLQSKYEQLSLTFENQSVTLKSGVYTLEEDLIVPAGCVLEIEKGTKILMKSGVSIIIHGAVNIKGESSAPVIIEADTRVNGFGSIEINGFYQEQSVIENLIVRNSIGHLENRAGFVINNSSVVMKNCVFERNNAKTCIEVNNSKVTMENCVFNDNSGKQIDIYKSWVRIHQLKASGNDDIGSFIDLFGSNCVLDHVESFTGGKYFAKAEHSIACLKNVSISDYSTFLVDEGSNRLYADSSSIARSRIIFETKNKSNSPSVIVSGVNNLTEYTEYKSNKGDVYHYTDEFLKGLNTDEILDKLSQLSTQDITEEAPLIKSFSVNGTKGLVDKDNKIIYVACNQAEQYFVNYECNEPNGIIRLYDAQLRPGQPIPAELNASVSYIPLELSVGGYLEQYRLYLQIGSKQPVIDVLEYEDINKNEKACKIIMMGFKPDEILVVSGVREVSKNTYAQNAVELNFDKKYTLDGVNYRDNWIIRPVIDEGELEALLNVTQSYSVFNKTLAVRKLKDSKYEGLFLFTEKLNHESITNNDKLRVVKIFERVNKNANFKEENVDFIFNEKDFRRISGTQPARKADDVLFGYHNGFRQRDDFADLMGEDFSELDQLVQWAAHTSSSDFNLNYAQYFDEANFFEFVLSQVLFGDSHFVMVYENEKWYIHAYAEGGFKLDRQEAASNNRLVDLALQNPAIRLRLKNELSTFKSKFSDEAQQERIMMIIEGLR